ncbi:hypothetical protein MMC10_005352 [Thelotrema lepadinum]|nr:hypothetical protein [Thelotrema lepadinum]
MAFLIGPLFGAAFGGITSAVNNNKEDQNFRNGWTQQQLGEVSSKNPGKNIMIVYVKHDASKLVNSQMSQIECDCPASKSKLSYSCYIFDSGPFQLQGDGGYLNWAFTGNFVRDKNKVTFSKPA